MSLNDINPYDDFDYSNPAEDDFYDDLDIPPMDEDYDDYDEDAHDMYPDSYDWPADPVDYGLYEDF